MPSTFDTLAASTVTPFYDMHGENVTYKPASGGSRTVKAIIDREGRSAEFVGQLTNDYNGLIIRIRSANNTIGVTTPQELEQGQNPDKVTIDGSDWLVQRWLNKGAQHGEVILAMFDGGES